MDKNDKDEKERKKIYEPEERRKPYVTDYNNGSALMRFDRRGIIKTKQFISFQIKLRLAVMTCCLVIK